MTDRLPPVPGEWIDRSAPITFTFEGREHVGFAGDVIASALHAAGVRALGRSFKYHRLRGVMSLANHDVNTLMQWGARLNLRADVTPLATGMELTAVNTRGGLAKDRLAVMDRLSALLPVGFYYKAFHKPKRWFPFFERVIRDTSGLGRVDFDTPRLRTAKRYAWCDVLVIGGGAAGLSAALAAADCGASVVLVDENARLGGSLGYRSPTEPANAQALHTLLERVHGHAGIQVLTATEAAGYYADHWVPLVDPQRMTKMRARAVVMATGAFEQPAVFRNNDLPGVMMGSAAQRLIHRYAVRPLRRAVVLVANDAGYEVALDLARHGTQVAAILDFRPGGAEGAAAREAAAAGMEILAGWAILEALPKAGRDGVAGALGVALGSDGAPDMGRTRRFDCDGVVMSVGWAPAANLLYQAGMKPRYDASVEQFVPRELPAGVFAAGRVNGVHETQARVADGTRAGQEAARAAGVAVPEREWHVPAEAASPTHPFPIVAHPDGKNFVDFDEDLQLKDFFNAAQEGFDNIELLKRYTTVGMGPSQGKHSNMNALRILARIRGLPPEAIGTTTARPFFHPVPLSHLAGRGFHPERVTPMHGRHVSLGAKLMPAGAWWRPEYYPRQGIGREQAIAAEVAAVHQGVGLIDVGTLGKLEVHGRDAAEFLERAYTGRFATMKPGGTRYALMLDESGVVADDGVVARLSEHHFYFTTTTGNSASIYRELSRQNAIWRLEAGLVNLTGSMAAVNLAGPLSRAVLAPLTDLDLSNQAFPYLGVREATVAGIPARLMRVGFVGELGYEIHVPAEYGRALWDNLMAAGAADGIVPFGVEAQRILRLEKGHHILGQDTDGLTSPFEAGLGFAVKMDKPYFVGQRSLRIRLQRPAAQKLVPFRLPPGHPGPTPRECHLVISGGEIAGRVTSVATSVACEGVIGLAYVRNDLAIPGQEIAIRVDGSLMVHARVVEGAFYDPSGTRQRVEDEGATPGGAAA